MISLTKPPNPTPAKTLLVLVLAAFSILAGPANAAGGSGHAPEPAYVDEHGHTIQQAQFPLPLSEYAKSENAATQEPMGIMDKLKSRMDRDPFNLVATIIFVLAILHTFAASTFNRLAHKFEHRHREEIEKQGRTAAAKPHDDAIDDVSFASQMFHFLGEVEAIFGIWVIALAGAATYFYSWHDVTEYIAHDVNFTEPMFVVIIMAIASSRPVLRLAESALAAVARIGGSTSGAWWWSILTIAPILGSFITEPAAMTIGALLLGKKFYDFNPSKKLAYATLGLLFVNISVGGTLTNFAAPPVLMVAAKWEWSTSFMMVNYGWKAIIGILVSNTAYFLYFRKELSQMPNPSKDDADLNQPLYWAERNDSIPAWVTSVHVLFLGWTVFNAHYPALYIGGFLFFLAFVEATKHHQNNVSLRGPLLVGFFLAGLVIHGGCQKWWIEPILTGISSEWTLMLGSTLLTAFNDNAAITFLASQAPGLTDAAKYAVVAGAVTGGGLTVIANAPNPAGQSILGKYFPDGVVPLYLVLGAAVPTFFMVLAFMAITR